MSSIEWLISQLNKQGFAQVVTDEEIQKAEAMHRQEIMNAVRVVLPYGPSFTEAEQYYNNTFKKD